ncbi:unnamed protein product [Tilletia controversa]|nr:unnamed protein product [Tilletia controversa]
MASGFGYTGGPSRCYQFFQEFRKCYASIARTRAVKEHLLERVAKEVKEARSRGELSASGNPIRLGLIVADDAPSSSSESSGSASASGSGSESEA